MKDELNFQEILKTIDQSKMVTDYVYYGDMMDKEFEMYDYIGSHEPHLVYCYYHSWICTDTEVGLRVWYIKDDDEDRPYHPVCISFKPYRKYDEVFYWMSNLDRQTVKDYLQSLVKDNAEFKTVLDARDLQACAESIEYKKHENKNIKQ